MKDTLVYIGDDLLDLYPKTVIAITFQKLDTGNLTARSLSYTNQIKVPRTENNESIFEQAGNENITTSIPYGAIPCRVEQEGIELISGYCFLTGSNRVEYSLNIYENLIDIFNDLNGVALNMMNTTPVSSWTASGIDAARANTSGIVSLVISWGKAGSIYQTNYFLPSFYYHSIVTTLLEKTGLTLSGDILTSTKFTDLVMPFNGDMWQYPKGHPSVGSAGIINSDGTSINIFTNIAAGTHTWVYLFNPADTNDFFPGGNTVTFNTDNETIRWDGMSEVRGTFSTSLSIDITTSDTPTWDAYAVLYRNGSVLEVSPSQLDETSNPTGGAFSYNFTEITLTTSDIFYVELRLVIALGPDVIDSVDTTALTVRSLNLFTPTVVNRSNVAWNLLFKDVQCLDIIKDFFTRFAIIPKQVGNTLILKTIDEICADISNAVDWSEKRTSNTTDELSFKSSYAQNNNFEYSDSTDDNVGLGIMKIANTTLPLSTTVFTSIFENSNTEIVDTSYTVAVVPVYDSSSTDIDEFADSPGIKLVTLKARSTEPAITFNVTPRTNYKLGYFVDVDQPKDTGFDYFLDNFYSSFTASLQKNKVITRTYNLTSLDILNYDPHKMVYDGDGYYLVNKISNYIPGKLVKVELFKIM